MSHKSAQNRIAVISAKGERATVIAVPNPMVARQDGIEPELVYGIGGLAVDKISENQFRDFQGTV